jgi:hypothetical protein
MSSDNPYQGQPGPYGQGDQESPPPGPYGYPQSTPPSGDAGYAFGPFAPQQGTGPGAAGPPPGPIPGPTPQPAEPRRGRLWIIFGVVALALILIGVTAALVVWRTEPTVQSQPAPTQVPGRTPASSPTSAPPAALASDAVSGYLNALAAGDATTALSYSADPVQPGPFMTNKVLAESIKRAPLTAIEVPEVTDQQATTVSATYRLGKTEVSTSYDVVNSSGTWKLATVHKTIDLGLVRSPSIPMRINGVRVNSDLVDLLPGSYAFTAGSPNLTYGSKNVVTITDPKGYSNVLDLRPSLSDRGRKTVRNLAKTSFNACLRTRVPEPRNCPFAWNNPTYRFRSGSVTWRRTGPDPFAKPRVELSGRSARVHIQLRVRIAGPCLYQGRSGYTCTGSYTGEGLASIRLDREKLSVVWLR